MAKVLLTAIGVSCAILAALYQMYINPLMQVLGVFHTVQPFGLKGSSCTRIPELQACEKIVLHQPSGILYLACSSPEGRVNWSPATGRFNAQGRAINDYIATFDPETSKITRLQFENFNSGNQPISLHGMDVVPSSSNANELYVYLVNHRAPPAGHDPKVVGADSVIEVFKTTVSGKRLTHITTVRDPAILTPNDVVGQADGQGFYFTNDHGNKAAFARELRAAFSADTSVGYCHVDHGCKIAASGLVSSNGIVKASNDTIYVASTLGAKVTVFERQADNSLLLTDVIPTEQALDNLSLDADGAVWGAAFPKVLEMDAHMQNSSHLSPVSGLKIYANTGPNSFYGEKYKVEKMFEDDGVIVSGSTSIVHDSKRKKLFMHGYCARYFTVCNI